jgi:hypothetical protein
MPYGLEHAKIIEAAPLSSEIIAWERRGARTNELSLMEYSNSRACLELRTTSVTACGTVYEVVLALENKAFQGKGYLLGARGGVVIWEGTNGTYKVIHKGRGGQ